MICVVYSTSKDFAKQLIHSVYRDINLIYKIKLL